jgi:hypothetical protein
MPVERFAQPVAALLERALLEPWEEDHAAIG